MLRANNKSAPLITGFVEAIGCPVAVASLKTGCILAVNAAWRRLVCAHTSVSSVGRPLGELFPLSAEVVQTVATYRETAKLGCAQLTPGPGGAATWWDLECAPHPGLADTVIVTASEATARVLARREAQDAQAEREPIDERLRLAQESLGIGTWEWDAAADRHSWSPHQFRLHGLDPAAALPPSLDEWIGMVHPDDRPQIHQLLTSGASEAGDSRHHLELRIRRADTGEERWLLSRGCAIKAAPGGPIIRVVGINLDITDRHAEQQKLREEEAQLRLAGEAAKIFAWEWDVASGRVTWAPGLEKEAGLTPGGFGGTVDAFRALIHPEDQPQVEQALNRALSGEDQDYRAEFRMMRADGTVRWTATRAAVERNASGRPVRVIGMDYDITAFKALEATLRARERQQAAVAQLGRFALAVRSSDAVMNEAQHILSGTLDVEFTSVLELQPDGRTLVLRAGLGWADSAIADRIAVPADRDSQSGYTLLEDAGPVIVEDLRTETRFRGANLLIDHGVISGMSVVIQVADTGRPWGILGVHTARKRHFTEQDVAFLEAVANILTEALQRYRNESALQQREAWLRDLLEAMPQFAFTTSPEGKGEYKNTRWTQYTGRGQDQLQGLQWTSLLHPDDVSHTMTAWSTALAMSQPYEVEHRLRARDGSYRWFLSRAVPSRSADGRILRWIGSATDISSIVAARESARQWAADLTFQITQQSRALTEAAVELKSEMRRRMDAQTALLQSQKLEALGQLTAGVAHDFNNVLAAIQGNFELIGRRIKEPRVLDMVASGIQATQRAVSLARQLLDFGRQETSATAIVDVRDALHRADDLIGHAVGAAIARELDFQADLWPILVDGHRLEIALLNLAINARDAMPNGGKLTVAARNLGREERPDWLPPRDYIAISVRDTGTGMPPEVLARVTEPFFTTKPEGKGTGLGLPMARNFAENAGGGLRIESRIGEGTCVELILPQAAVSEIAQRPAQLEAPVRAANERRNATILLVEDEDSTRQITAAYLREQGYAVVDAPSAEAALVLAHTIDTLDLLLTDVAMPGATGPDLAERLRADRPQLRVLFITGRPGFVADDPVLPKPFTGRKLDEAIQRQLGPSANVTPGDGKRLLRRMRSPTLCAAYLAWRAAGHGLRLPPLPRAGWGGMPGADTSFIVAVETDGDRPGFRFVQVGSALETRLGRSLTGTLVSELSSTGGDDPVVGTLETAYRRCAGTLAPTHEYAKFNFGDGSPVTFERLILPVSADGQQLTHLIGLAEFSGDI